MKKILVSFIAMMAVASSAWAAETMNMHDQVNNAQAPAHQKTAILPPIRTWLKCIKK